MTLAAVRNTTDVARPIKVLVPMIKEALMAGDEAGIEHYRRAGEMLLEAKEQIAYGDFAGWLKRNFHLGQTTAYRYMKLAEHRITTRGNSSSLRAAMREINRNADTGHATWDQPVKKVLSQINYEALRQDDLKRAEGRDLERKLGLQLIDIGFKVLAQKLHPDKKGGSQESFVRLKSVRDRLKQAV